MSQIQTKILTSLLTILVTGIYCSNVLAGTFTVRGVFIPDEVPTHEDEELTENVVQSSPLAEAPVRVLARENSIATDTSSKVLATGNMSNGSISLTGEVDDTMTVTISVDAGLEVPLTLDAVVAPGREVLFALFEWPTIVAFLGTVNSVQDSSQQFSIFGDLTSVSSNLEHATVTASIAERDALGEPVSTTWHVLLQDNQFEIVGEVTEPRIVNIFVYKGVNFSQTQAVVEPGAEIEVATQTNSLKDLYAISPAGTGRHALLIDSWQQAPDYWATRRSYAGAVEEHQKELLTKKMPTAETADKRPVSETSTLGPETVEQEVADEDTNEDTDECAKYSSRQRRAISQTSVVPPENVPEHVKIFRELNRLRLDPLESLADGAEDPINSLLAIELGAYWGEPKRQDIYDRLILTLDRDIVKRRVTHDRNEHARFLNQQQKIFSLRIGTKAPEFALRNLDGTTIELYDIVQDHEHILVEFWASWCGPCVDTLPALKDVYAKQNADGFEIVSVSIDESHADWVGATTKYEIPWTNLAELKDSNREVVDMYGVRYIPKNYLLDNNGCIVQKDVSSRQLEQMLTAAKAERILKNSLENLDKN